MKDLAIAPKGATNQQFDYSSVSSWFTPLLFIVLWSSGYIGGAIGLNYAEPFTMTLYRFGTATLILVVVALLTKAPWPRGMQAVHIIIVGVLIQATQFGGLYSGMNAGVPAAVSALIVGTMPIFTAMGAWLFLGERVSSRQWLGLSLGVVGVALVVSEGLHLSGTDITGYFYVCVALFGITAGTLYQKKFCQAMDLRTGGAIQLGVASIIMFLLASSQETMQVDWGVGFLVSTGWLALMNSIGAISLMFLMLRRGQASKVASLFYLIPATTALMATVVLGDSFQTLELIGFAVVVAAVYLVHRPVNLSDNSHL